MSVVTLDENYKGSGVTLSEDKLSCTYTKTNFVRATKGVSFGKWYWEVKLTGSGDIRSFAGIVSEDATDKNVTSYLYGPIGTYLGLQSGYCYAIATCPNFLMYKESHLITNTRYGLEYYTPDTWIGIALDLDNKTIRCTYKGNDLGLMWDGLESATYYPAFSLDGGRYDGDKNGVYHANFGATPFKYPIPEGYVSYDGNQSNANKYLLKDGEGYKNLTELISTEIPTEEQFQEKGMSDIPSCGQLSNFNDLVTYAPSPLLKSLVKFKPKAKTVLSSGAINFSGKELKKVSLIGTDNARVLFSKDRGLTWHGDIKAGLNPATDLKTYDDGSVIGTGYYDDGTRKEYPWKAFCIQEPIEDGNYGNKCWYVIDRNSNYTGQDWIQYDFGDNPEKIITQMSFITFSVRTPKGFFISGSNDGSKFITLYTGVAIKPNNGIYINKFSFNNNTFYRFIRLTITSVDDSYLAKPMLAGLVYRYYKESMITPILISDISTQGLTPTQLTAITPEEWKSFMGDSSTLRFAYYLPDETANTDKLELTVDFVGE